MNTDSQSERNFPITLKVSQNTRNMLNDLINIRPMKEQDYEEVRSLWMTIKGFGIRTIDDSRESIVRFIRRNRGISCVAETQEGEIIGVVLCGHGRVVRNGKGKLPCAF